MLYYSVLGQPLLPEPGGLSDQPSLCSWRQCSVHQKDLSSHARSTEQQSESNATNRQSKIGYYGVPVQKLCHHKVRRTEKLYQYSSRSTTTT
jgi:hypothetical protein